MLVLSMILSVAAGLVFGVIGTHLGWPMYWIGGGLIICAIVLEMHHLLKGSWT